MKRRTFIQSAAVATGAGTLVPSFAEAGRPLPQMEKDIYELRIYQLTSGGAKKELVNFIKTAFTPYVNSKGGKAGFFSEYSLQEPPKLYLLTLFPDAVSYYSYLSDIDSDSRYQSNAAEYFRLPAEKPLFSRYETILLEAFDAIPHFRKPDPSRGLIELRLYESYNEDAGRRKIKMFNTEELPLFDKIGLNALFFGKILAGTHMPALAYTLWFKDMAAREEAWAKFRAHPDWKAMSNKPEYANTVSTVNKIFLLPEEGSQI